MDGLAQINLKTYIEAVGEPEASSVLASFVCPMNLDVQEFLRKKAKVFATQGITQTHLVFASYRGEPVLVGYYSLALKMITVKKTAVNSKTAKRLSRFGPYNQDTRSYEISAPLIAQLGKNFANGYNKLITGDELLSLACDKLRRIQQEVGGRVAYLECEDKPELLDFYERNGFCNFGKRLLDKDEREVMSGEYLIQMLKYLGDKPS